MQGGRGLVQEWTLLPSPPCPPSSLTPPSASDPSLAPTRDKVAVQAVHYADGPAVRLEELDEGPEE